MSLGPAHVGVKLTYMMCSMLRYVTHAEGRMLVNGSFLGDGLSLQTRSLAMKTLQVDNERTVNSLMRVDFPAPFGPITPTRLEITLS